jgi:hypothetical protein
MGPCLQHHGLIPWRLASFRRKEKLLPSVHHFAPRSALLLYVDLLPSMSCRSEQAPNLLAHSLLCFPMRWPSSRRWASNAQSTRVAAASTGHTPPWATHLWLPPAQLVRGGCICNRWKTGRVVQPFGIQLRGRIPAEQPQNLFFF